MTGYAMEAPKEAKLFDTLQLENNMHSVIGDIRDREKLISTMQEAQPEIVLHLAAQPIVRESYKDPVGTYETNVMGTVNILEAVRQTKSVKSFLNVTTDKVYKNNEWEWGYLMLSELASLRLPFGLTIERDIYTARKYVRDFLPQDE